MNDQLGLFDRKDDDTGNVDLDELRAALARSAAEPPKPAVRPVSASRRAARARREALLRRRKRRRRHTLAALVVLVVLAGAITAGLLIWRKKSIEVPDFAGTAGPEVVIRVQSGDNRDAVAQALSTAGVVASSEAFLNATVNDGDVARIRPGYYKLHSHLSAQDAANALVAPASRVGQLRLVPGRQLADVSTRTGGGGTVTPGYITDIAKAACVPLNGTRNCFTAADLWAVEKTADPLALGVPDWGIAGVKAAVDPARRLEGLIVPGDVDVPPNSTPFEALQAVMFASAAAWSTSDLVAGATTMGVTPYQAVTIASVVEREGINPDMPKIARVVYNRIENRMLWQMDSTINYSLDRSQISLTAAELRRPSPYNTYLHKGFPPTPISSPGSNALQATLAPDDGDWLFFVKVDKQGYSCFSVTNEQHEACKARARKNGVGAG